MRRHRNKLTALVLTAVMGASLAVPAGSLSAVAAEKPTLLFGNEAVAFKSDEAAAEFISDTEKSIPSSFDLRNVDGKNYVTQVKFQNPYSACWAFATAAASETSLLYENGITNEEYEKKNGGKEMDLSEKALAHYVFHGITDADVGDNIPKSQVGEGADFSVPESENFSCLDNGGFFMMATGVLASGMGPVTETTVIDGDYPFAYRGKNGWTEYDDYTNDAVKATAENYWRESYREDHPDDFTEEAFQEWYMEKKVDPCVANGGEKCTYSRFDDWSLPSDYKHREGSSMAILQEGYLLPSPAKHDENGIFTENDEAGIVAIKNEVANGRPVAISYKSDRARPGEEDNPRFINPVTNAQYVYDGTMGPSHAVTIVGYDDNYSLSNFYTGTDDKGNSKTPPAPGAFICKNSWGSINDKTDGKRNYNDFGVDGSGYFYLSYYDKSIVGPESFNYYTEKDSDSPADNKNYIDQYDFLPQLEIKSETYADIMTMANVFTAARDQKLTHISTETASPNTTVTYEVYKLNANNKNPKDGVCVASGSQTCEFGGYHRIALNNKCAFAKDTRYSVVVTQAVPTDNGTTYELLVGCQEEKVPTDVSPFTVKGIVNKGESFLYTDQQLNWTDAKWMDWTDYTTNELKPMMEGAGLKDVQFDNFPIKAYSVSATKEELSTDLSKAKVTLKNASKNYSGKVQNPAVKSVTLNGKTIPESAYTVSILNAKGTAKASPKNAGSYVVKITGNMSEYYTGSAKATYKINPVANTIKFAGKSTKKALTIKVKRSSVKKKAKTFKITRKGKGKISITKKCSAKRKKYISLSKGKVVLKKKAPKGKYKFIITVAANSNWKKTKSKLITLKVK